MKIKTNRKGFTIVELVIVVAVIGILSAILIPTFSNLIQKANDTALQQNLRNSYAKYTEEQVLENDLVEEVNARFVNEAGTKMFKYDEAQNKFVEVTSFDLAEDYVLVAEGPYNGYKIYQEK